MPTDPSSPGATPVGGESAGQIVIYHEDSLRLQVRLVGHSAWLSQRHMAELFQIAVSTVNQHIAGIYAEGEVDPEATIRKFRIVPFDKCLAPRKMAHRCGRRPLLPPGGA